jgi:hypothetical protein
MKPTKALRVFGLVILLAVVWFIAQSKIASAPHAYGDKPSITLSSITYKVKHFQADADIRLIGAYQLKATGTDQLVGLSDLVYHKDKMGLLSDQGLWFETENRGDDRYEINNIMYLADHEGREWSDSEDIAVDKLSGQAYFSFERQNRLKVYDGDGKVLNTFRPSGLFGIDGNQGMEGLGIGNNDEGKTVLVVASEKGDFFLCPEFSSERIDKCHIINAPDLIPSGFRPVSLDALEKGDGWLILYRSFDMVSGLKTILVHAHLNQNDWRDQKILLRLEKGSMRDNYEGVSALKTQKGYEIALISDPLSTQSPPRLILMSWNVFI